MTTRVELVKPFTGEVCGVRRIIPYVSRGKNSLPVPSPRPARGQRLEYQAKEVTGRVIITPEWFAKVAPELDLLERALTGAVTQPKRKWWRFW